MDAFVERLLHIHYHGWALPERLRAWLVSQLNQSPALARWGVPVESWLADRRSFFVFIDDQWRSFLHSHNLSIADDGPVYEFSPLAVDFNRPSIRLMMDFLSSFKASCGR